MALKLLLLAPSKDTLAALPRQLPPGGDEVETFTVVGGASQLVAEVERARPDLVVGEVPDLTESGLGGLERALTASPSTSMILLTPNRSPEFLLKAMRSGVREVVPTPLVDGELRDAYLRLTSRIVAQRAGGGKMGRVLVFIPAKGGSGSTFISTNLGYALAARGQRVAVLDLNLHFGDAALFLSEQRAERTIADVAKEVSRIDATFLESSMLQVADKLWILPAPDSPESAIDVKPEAVEQIVSLARSRFDFVIVDMGRILEASTLRALDQADAIYVTVQLTLPFIHDAKRLFSLLRSLGYGREKLRVIVNRYDKGDEISLSDVEEALGVPVDQTIPNGYQAVAYSINHGVPVLKSAPRDAVAKTLAVMADRLAPKPAARKRGWFGR
jgi:pilus assembly protein CpaE